MGCNDIEIRKSEFVANRNYLNYFSDLLILIITRKKLIVSRLDANKLQFILGIYIFLILEAIGIKIFLILEALGIKIFLILEALGILNFPDS